MEKEIVTIARNKKAYHDFEILEKIEAGIVLCGTEIKAIRDNKVNFRDSFVDVVKGEAWLVGFYIAPYAFGSYNNHSEDRKRKLLLHSREIYKLHQKVKERGFTLVPLEIYLKHGRAKMIIGLSRGKAMHDKRDDARKKDHEREMQRAKDKYR